MATYIKEFFRKLNYVFQFYMVGEKKIKFLKLFFKQPKQTSIL